MVTLQVIPDRWKEQDEGEKLHALSRRGSGSPHIRRPTRGIVLKEDTFATLRVVAGNGAAIKLIDAGSKITDRNGDPLEVNGKRATNVYSNFLLQGVSEDRMEKQQIIETFGEPFIFLFGERARVMSFSGVLLNTFDFNWEAEWWENYEHYLRGTRCVENDARVYLSFDETIVSGYIIGTAATKNTQDQNYVNFQFQMFVTSTANFSRLGDPNAEPPTSRGPLLPGGAAPSRPQIITSDTQLGGANVDKFGNLVEGLLKFGLSPAVSAWKGLQQIVGDAFVNTVNETAGLIRVPVGFAGSLVFDDSFVRPKRFDGNQTAIKYTTFQDNTDEYVGSSSHYSSAVSDSGAVNQISLTTPEEELAQDQKLVDKATEIWTKAGYRPPKGNGNFITSKLINLGVGLVGVGATKAWQAAADSGNTTFTDVTEFFLQNAVDSAVDTITGRRGASAVED